MGLRKKANSYLNLEHSSDTNRDSESDLSDELNLENKIKESNDQDDPQSFPFKNEKELNKDKLSEQNKIETLLNLLDTVKEVLLVENEESLWSTLLFTIVGHLGVKQVALFYLKEEKIILKAEHGFDLPLDHPAPKRSQLIRELNRDHKVHYGSNLIDKLASQERDWLTSIKPELVVPILKHEELKGFLLVGIPIEGSSFLTEDLIYCKLLGELIGSMESSISKIEWISGKQKQWELTEIEKKSFYEFQESLNQAENIDILKENLINYLQKQFLINSFVFLVKKKDSFYPIIHNGFQNTTINKLDIPLKEPWIKELCNQNTWIKGDKIKNKKQLFRYLSPEDRRFTSKLILLSIELANQSMGVFIATTDFSSLENETPFYLEISLKQIFLFINNENLSLRLASEKDTSLKNKLNSLNHILKENERNIQLFPYSIMEFKITNFKQIKNLLSTNKVNKFRELLYATFKKFLTDRDFFTEVDHGIYLIISPEVEKADIWATQKKMIRNIQHCFLEKKVAPTFKSKILSRPKNKFSDIEKLISLNFIT